MADKVNVNAGINTPAGYGVVNGVPYGDQLHGEKEALEQQLHFQPAERERLRAQTRKALGRG